MKLALITTTIRVPEVLSLYRKLDKDVQIFVAGDRKTPHADVRAFVKTLGAAEYFSDEDQEKMGWRSSEIIGWNKIMRRNIALLEALRWGADAVVTIDDDNIPLSDDYFATFRRLLGGPWDGLLASSQAGWFNIGDYLDPQVYHRGFPHSRRGSEPSVALSAACGLKIGVAAGLWFGDPDIDAVERIVKKPLVRGVSEVVRSGVAVAKRVFSPVNSQNTAYLREVAPLMMVLVGVGRFDDIWGSYIAERVLAETDYVVHYGRPFVWQERNPQSSWRNLKDEILGMEFTDRFCDDLMKIDLSAPGTILQRLERVYAGLRGKDYLLPVVQELGAAWLSDVAKALKK